MISLGFATAQRRLDSSILYMTCGQVRILCLPRTKGRTQVASRKSTANSKAPDGGVRPSRGQQQGQRQPQPQVRRTRVSDPHGQPQQQRQGNLNPKVKSVGQECPTHTGLFHFPARCSTQSQV